MRRLAEDAIPGLAAGIVCGDRLAWAHGFGVVALDDPRPVTPATRFRIASITKLFTATAVMRLHDQGTLDLDDAVRAHVPSFVIGRSPGVGDGAVTIRHLLTHTSGLPRDSRLTDFGRLFQPDRETALAVLPTDSIRSEPGTVAAYSNLGYGVLGELVATVTSMSFADYLHREILGSMRMTGTLVHPTPEDDVAWGHGPRPAHGPRAKAGFWELGFATPAGGMASSVQELSRFAVLHLSPYLGLEAPLLSAGALREMHRVQHVVHPERGGYGIGWGVEVSRGQHVVYHGGELPEQTAFLLLDLRARVGVIVLANAQDVDASGLAQEILRIVRLAIEPDARVPARAIP